MKRVSLLRLSHQIFLADSRSVGNGNPPQSKCPGPKIGPGQQEPKLDASALIFTSGAVLSEHRLDTTVANLELLGQNSAACSSPVALDELTNIGVRQSFPNPPNAGRSTSCSIFVRLVH